MTGTKIPAIRSVIFWTGALLPWASCTIWMICDNIVSAPVFSVVKRKAPFWLIVPAYTFSPGCLCTGTGSPLSILSSTYDEPSVTVPSTAMRSPGLMTIVSPGRASSTGIVCSPDGLRTVTVRGCNPISFLMAVVVLCLARSSSNRPKRIKAIITEAASK